MTEEDLDYHKRVGELSKAILTTSMTFITILIAILGFMQDRTILSEIKYPLIGVLLLGLTSFVTSLVILLRQVEKKDITKLDYGNHLVNIEIYSIILMVAVLVWIIYTLSIKLPSLPKT